MISLFTKKIILWNRSQNSREMPWKGEKDPYRIWLSEIILQQTRVEQGLNYYNRFIKKYPTVFKLAAAPDQEVFKLWEGLGYYNRCRNLLFTAREIVEKYKGIFPRTYDDILHLKGVGPYTAAAIASFAYNLPHAVVDGNVFRVLSRFYGIDTAIDSTAGKQVFSELAHQKLDKKWPGEYNQAIMDFGATVCKPAAPACSHCPLQANCSAYQTGMVNRLPVKEKVLTRKSRYFNYFVFECDNKTWVRQRTGKDIWQDLFEFYLVETGKSQRWTPASVTDWLQEQLNIQHVTILEISSPLIQQLTHQQISGCFIRVALKKIPSSLSSSGQWQTQKGLSRLAFPRLLTQYLSAKGKS
ncbi:A/G-specific adenine glycosylase [Sediminibacterium sp.]|uniref:A/G-specific adenine glycosylase n=1 Tax=Sediminibacterium sp. TaxID=1917865 RepID=UPI0025F1D3E2|nr:A/G-specific adenine glycosylase [Sediminibacterium sp.]MBW0178916.1 A/G-specific adenine glycosylase [Sediminibacterium sp.]